MFGCYRKGDANDPEIYVAAIGAILSEYPQSVIDYVTDPRTGMPRRSKWLPNPAEIAEACEEQMAPIRAADARRKRTEQQLAERDQGQPSDEEHERIAGKFTQLTATLRAGATGERIQSAEDAA